MSEFLEGIRDHINGTSFSLPSELQGLCTVDEFAAIADQHDVNVCFEDLTTPRKFEVVRLYLGHAAGNERMPPTVPLGALLPAKTKQNVRAIIIDALRELLAEDQSESKSRADELLMRMLCASVNDSTQLEPSAITDIDGSLPFGRVVRCWWNMEHRTRFVVEEASRALAAAVAGMRARGISDDVIRTEIIERFK